MRPPRWGSPPTVGWRVLLGGGVDAATAGLRTRRLARGTPSCPGTCCAGAAPRGPVATSVRFECVRIAAGGPRRGGWLLLLLVRHVRGVDADYLVVRVHEPLGERLQRLAALAGEHRREPPVAVAAVQLQPGLVEEARRDARCGARDRLDDDAGDHHAVSTLSIFTAQILNSGCFEMGSTASMVMRLHMCSASCMCTNTSPARARRELRAERLRAAPRGDLHAIPRADPELRAVVRVQLGDRLVVRVAELPAVPGHRARVPVLDHAAGGEVKGVPRVGDLRGRLVRAEPHDRASIGAPVELQPLRVVGGDERVLAPHVAALRAGVPGGGQGPEESVRLLQRRPAHAAEVVRRPLAERQDLLPRLRRLPPGQEPSVPEPPRELAEDLEVASRRARRLHRLLEQLVAPLGAAVDALLLRPEGRRQDHVRELRGPRRVERLGDDEERPRSSSALRQRSTFGSDWPGFVVMT